MKKTKTLSKVIPTLLLAFTLASCGESKELKELRPGVIADLIEESVSKFNRGPVNSQPTQYAERLETVLNAVPTKDLLLLRDYGVTVGLDQRLGSQEKGVLDSEILAVYYPKERALSLWDDGKPSNDKGLSSFCWGDEAIEEFADGVRSDGGLFSDTPIDIKKDFLLADSHTMFQRSGNVTTTTTYLDWDKPEDFDKDSIRKNPNIINKAPTVK